MKNVQVKKIMLLCTILLFFIISMLALSSKVFATAEDDYSYRILGSGGIAITKYKGKASEVVIPSVIDGKTVEAIDSIAFDWMWTDSVTKIEIPSSIIMIAPTAFQLGESLKEINVDSNNNYYMSEDGVVYTKDKTKLIVCPSGKESVEIPNTVTTIEEYAFLHCSRLTTIEIPCSVINIKFMAFSQCTNLKRIELSNSIEMIENYAFSSCRSLTNIELPNSMTIIGVGLFEECSSLSQVEIPEGIRSIKDNAFDGCSSLTKIEIPDSVTSIGDEAFKGIEPDITIYGYKSEYVKRYAERAGINYQELEPKKKISNCEINELPNKIYSGKEIKTNIILKDGNLTLKEGTDYTVIYSNNINVGRAILTIKGKGNYTGIITKTFEIVAKNLSEIIATIDTENKTYTGKAQTANITLKDGNTTLNDGTDYEVAYTDNTNAGAVTITITGKCNYTGTLIKTFEIVAKDLSTITATVNTENKTYTGKAQTTNITLKDGSRTLKEGTDYIVSYKNNINVGTATVEITGKGNYSGKIVKNFAIIAKPTSSEEPTQPSKPSTENKYKLGDINKDGKIDTKDAREALLSYVGKTTLTAEQKQLADVNKDGKVDTKDARQILLFYVGKIKNF